MKKEDKALLIDSFVETLKNYPHFYVVDVTALNSQTTSDLRRECFKNEIKLMVVKNKLFIKALAQVGEEMDAFVPALKQNTAIMFCNTANKPARLIKKFAKNNGGMPALKAAYAEEGIYVGAEHLETLCALKSKNELIADVVAALESPIMNIINALENREESAAAAE
ncbi:MAG: 50S ribosomal protein L10 [Prevotellaceae bacterium]|nr:50S ribosomal protein L10 [Candidatus Minthosoma equi]